MKHWKYLCYLLRHKWFVGRACFRYGRVWQGIVHDWSKFRPDEWFPYANFFYGEKPSSLFSKNAFDLAWLKHQHRNPHHWQHWVLREDSGDIKCLEMPENALVEMICDWEGAGLAITGKRETRVWYEKNKEHIQLHELSRNLAEALL